MAARGTLRRGRRVGSVTVDDLAGEPPAESLRLAAMLCGGDRAAAERLAAAVLAGLPAGAEASELRAELVRAYLANPPVVDHSAGTIEPEPAAELVRRGWQGLAHRYARLSRRQRALIALRYHAGLSEAGVADAMGIGAGTARGGLARARVALGLRPGEPPGSAHAVGSLPEFLALLGGEQGPAAGPERGAMERPARPGAARPRSSGRRRRAAVPAFRTLLPEAGARTVLVEQPAGPAAAGPSLAAEPDVVAAPAAAHRPPLPPAAPRPVPPQRRRQSNELLADLLDALTGEAIDEPAESAEVAPPALPEPAAVPGPSAHLEQPSEAGSAAGSLAPGEVEPAAARVSPPRSRARSHRPPAQRSRRGIARRSWPVLAAVGVVLAGAVTAMVLLIAGPGGGGPSHPGTSSSPTTRPPVALLPNPVGVLLPGAKVVGQYSGTGPATVRAGRPEPGAGRQLTVDALCTGQGPALIGPVVVSSCAGVPVGAVVGAADLTALQVTAAEGTRWRFAVVDEPVHGTNGALQYPVAAALRDPHVPGVLASASGTGSATVALAGSPGAHNTRLLLTCRGSGVAFASADHRFDGNYTHTCVPGWSYEFDVAGATVPGLLYVTADPGTNWQLVVVST